MELSVKVWPLLGLAHLITGSQLWPKLEKQIQQVKIQLIISSMDGVVLYIAQ